MTPPETPDANPHYLEHLVATAARQGVEASEDIVSASGIKLLAKGGRLQGDTVDRLLQHKLAKPLEETLQVVGAVTPERLATLAADLSTRHALLRAIGATRDGAGLPSAFAAIGLSPPLRSLLSALDGGRPHGLEHAVGTAMIALWLARRLWPQDGARQQVIAVAGLMHDIGELYIDPACLRRDQRLSASQWRHIVVHPLLAHHVLHRLPGAGPAVAGAVLLHHERLDGFGYPRGVSGEAFTLDGQALAAADALMAMLSSQTSPLTRASMAWRLIPGQFSPAVLDAVEAAAREAGEAPPALADAPPLSKAAPRIERVAATLRRFSESREWIVARLTGASPELRAVVQAGLTRMQRIQSSFSSTGLDSRDPQPLLAELSAQGDARVYVEVVALVGELEWRLRELERAQQLRASLLPEDEQTVVGDIIRRLRGPRGAAGPG